MAGFFNPTSYSGPDKDAPTVEPPKPALFRFLQSLGQSFFRLVAINLIYFVLVAPLLAAAYVAVYSHVFTALGQDPSHVNVSPMAGLFLGAAAALPVWLGWVLLAVSAIVYGPVSCGLAYVLREATHQHRARVTDFFTRSWRNARQGVVLGLVDLVVLAFLGFNVASGTEGSTSLLVVRYISIAVAVIYAAARSYIFVMCATYELTVFQILKNALIFTGLGFWRNVAALAINTVLVGIVLGVGSILEVLALPLVIFVITGFISMYFCFRVITSHLPDPYV